MHGLLGRWFGGPFFTLLRARLCLYGTPCEKTCIPTTRALTCPLPCSYSINRGSFQLKDDIVTVATHFGKLILLYVGNLCITWSLITSLLIIPASPVLVQHKRLSHFLPCPLPSSYTHLYLVIYIMFSTSLSFIIVLSAWIVIESFCIV